MISNININKLQDISTQINIFKHLLLSI